jgi:hypothetical protein
VPFALFVAACVTPLMVTLTLAVVSSIVQVRSGVESFVARGTKPSTGASASPVTMSNGAGYEAKLTRASTFVSAAPVLVNA